LSQYAQQTNFPEPWPGGWWRMRDIIEYEEAAAYSILSIVARQREMFLTNFYRMGLEAVEKGEGEPPRAFLVPTDQRDMDTALKMLQILQRGGVQIHRANANFRVDGVEYPAGTYVVLMAQPFRAHAKDLLEVQHYPRRIPAPGAPPERPYDIAGWTLPLQMGVKVIKAVESFEADLTLVEKIPATVGKLHLDGVDFQDAVVYVFRNQANLETVALNRLFQKNGYRIYQQQKETVWKDLHLPRGAIILKSDRIPGSDSAELRHFAESVGIEIYALNQRYVDMKAQLRQPRLGLYKPWVANMDEGWTRWVLETHEFPYRNLTDAEIRAGNLADWYDAIILPDMRASRMIAGHAEGSLPPEYVGGIGLEGVANLRTYVEQGGTLICLNWATEVPMEHFGLEIADALESNRSNSQKSVGTQFFCPGSLLRVFVETSHPIGYGLEREMAVFFKSGPAFEARGGKRVAAYPNFNPLMSGWIEGEKRIRQKGALWDIKLGKGRVILFGFKPQHRAQSHGTFKLLFNAIYYSVVGK
jgi:hypothetical protein